MPTCNFVLPDETECGTLTARGNKCGKHKTRQKCLQCPSMANKDNLCVKHYAIENDKYCDECDNHAQYKAYTKCYTHSKTSAGKPKCDFDQCDKFAQSPSQYCCAHTKEVTGGSTTSQCAEEDCKSNVIRGGYCTKHGKENGIETLKCKFDGCVNNRKKGGLCKKHGKENGITLNIGCPHGKSQTSFCQTCDQPKHPEMWCKLCTMVCLRSNKSYENWEGYCFNCYRYTFPAKVTRAFQCRELAMRDIIAEAFPDLDIIFDKRIEGGRSGRRPDVLITRDTYAIVIECDEGQHKKQADYACENKRMMQIFSDLGNKHLVFIRFNPDAYDNVPSCFTKRGKIRQTCAADWVHRSATLIATITKCCETQPTKDIDLVHLFYDSDFAPRNETNVEVQPKEEKEEKEADLKLAKITNAMKPILANHFDVLGCDDAPDNCDIVLDMADFYVVVNIINTSSIRKLATQVEYDRVEKITSAFDMPVMFLYVNIGYYKINGAGNKGIGTCLKFSKETKYREKGESVFENRVTGIVNCCDKLIERRPDANLSMCYLFFTDYDAENLTTHVL